MCLTTVVDAAIQVTRTQRGVLLLAINQQGELQTSVARDDKRNSINHQEVQISSGVLKRVMTTRRELIVSDTGEDSAVGAQESVARLELHTVVAIPVEKLPMIEALDATVSTRQGELLGVLYLDSHDPSSAFSELDREVLRTLAREAANVIENARLFASSREKARLDHEIEIASEIQKANATQAISTPARAAGRGFTLWHAIPSAAIASMWWSSVAAVTDLFVGDISGKGVSASLLATLLQGVVYTTATLDSPPAAMVSRVNRFLCERSIEERYATMFYGVLTSKGAIDYVNAGHVPAILRRKNGELEALESSNFPVGLFPDAEFLNGTACMAKDDFLVIYTDGVSEATKLRGELLGDTRLAQNHSGFQRRKCGRTRRTDPPRRAILHRWRAAIRRHHAPRDSIPGKRGMNASRASKKDDASPLQRLDSALRAIQTEATPAELSSQIAALVASRDGVKGARIWHYVAEEPVVLAQHGQVPAPDAAKLEPLRFEASREIVDGKYAAWMLGPEGERRGALEVFSAAPLSNGKLDWLRLVRRYVDIALVSSERRSAVSELSIVVEATERLNSTLDLARAD